MGKAQAGKLHGYIMKVVSSYSHYVEEQTDPLKGEESHSCLVSLQPSPESIFNVLIPIIDSDTPVLNMTYS